MHPFERSEFHPASPCLIFFWMSLPFPCCATNYGIDTQLCNLSPSPTASDIVVEHQHKSTHAPSSNHFPSPYCSALPSSSRPRITYYGVVFSCTSQVEIRAGHHQSSIYSRPERLSKQAGQAGEAGRGGASPPEFVSSFSPAYKNIILTA